MVSLAASILPRPSATLCHLYTCILFALSVLSLTLRRYIYRGERENIEHGPDGERERRVEGTSDTLMEPEGTERRNQGNSREPQRRVRRRNEVPDNRPRLSVST